MSHETIYTDPTPNRFYVYAFLRESDNSPYYIGKGCGDRAWGKRRRGIRPPVDSTRIVLLTQESLTEPDAFAEEKRLIAFYGRKDLGTGILRNLTDGGEGPSDHKHTPETRVKMSAAQSGKKHSPESRIKMSAAKQNMSQKTRDKLSASKTGANNPRYGKTGAASSNFGMKYKTRRAKSQDDVCDQEEK